MKLDGSVAVVTGANRGLGAAFVQGLLARGAKVYAGARNVSSLAAVAKQHPDRVVPVELDVTSDASIASAALLAKDVTLLVNNAGRLDQLSLSEAGDLSSLRGEMEVNVFGLASMCLAFAPIMGNNGGGAIVNMLSRSSIAPAPQFGTYSATKAAAMSLTHSLRWDYECIGVDVIGVYASLVETEMVANLDMPKTTTDTVVARVLDGLEAGELDIAVDDASVAFRRQFHSGLDDVLRKSRARATTIRAKHPARKRGVV